MGLEILVPGFGIGEIIEVFHDFAKIAEFKDRVYKFSDMRNTVRTNIFQRRIRDFRVPRVLRVLSLLVIL